MILLGPEHAALQNLLENELAEVELCFARELQSDLACVNELAEHLEQYRGKMLRPTLVYLSGIAVSPEAPLSPAYRILATVVEMAHMATLVHDDVLDESDIRRRSLTVNHLHGNEAAVMLGDYLISHAYHLCSSLEDQNAARMVARATNTVCEGELLQLSNRLNWALDEPTYFEIIRRKTAALCGVSCRLGAMVAHADDAMATALDQYGEKLGTAFQIIDDVLDLMGDPDVVGKSLGKDIEKGKLTLPLIRHLAVATPEQREHIHSLLKQGTEQAAHNIGELLNASDSVRYAKATADRLVQEAKDCIAPLPDSSAKALLLTMADAVVTREF